MVVDDPVPAIAPGLMVQFPAGKPLNSTLPVATAQVGWVIVPTAGAAGAQGCKFKFTVLEFSESIITDPLLTIGKVTVALLETVLIGGVLTTVTLKVTVAVPPTTTTPLGCAGELISAPVAYGIFPLISATGFPFKVVEFGT